MVVNKKASWLVGKGMTIKVPQALHEITKPILDEVWEYNNKEQLLWEMAVCAGVTGDCFVIVTYQEATTAQLAINPYTKGKIRIRLLGSHQVFPYWNPLNKEELLSVRIITEVADFSPIQPGDDRRSPMTLGSIGVSRKRRYVEDIYPDRIVEGWDGEERTSRANTLMEIPLVHIVNEPMPNEYYGMSDLDGFIDIQREFNEKLTDISDIVNYHAAPITIITGGKTKNLERGPKSMWAFSDPQTKVFNLEHASDLPAANKYLETVMNIMFDISGVPEGSFGRIQAISNTSAAALEVQFGPLVEATTRKATSFEPGVEKINYFILRYSQLMNGQLLPVDLCAKCGGRIVAFKVTGRDGQERIMRKCYLINPQTLDFMEPDDVMVNIRRQYSFGTETRQMKYGRVKKEYGQKSASYWDPEDRIDLEKKAELDKAHEETQIEKDKAEGQTALDDQHAKAVELKTSAPPKPPAPKGAAK